MATLRETKDRIGSVRETLKITSAMKVVASAKLHKAQQAVQDLLPYEEELYRILSLVPDSKVVSKAADEDDAPVAGKTAVVAISSNGSLCGAFNSNVIKEAVAVISKCKEEGKEVDVFPVGRKMTDALKRLSMTAPENYDSLVLRPSFADSTRLSTVLMDRFFAGVYEKVILVYTHYVSTSTQKVKVEKYLPFELNAEKAVADNGEYILEPEPDKIIEELMPKVMKLKVHSVVLDSVAAEYAARTIAMQTATDNAQELIEDLTLEYNKGRQQKITSEILDLIGGAQ